MLETTKEERARWLADCGLTMHYTHCGQVVRLCRDVNTLEETLIETTRELAALVVATDLTLGVPDKPSEGHDHVQDVLARAQAVLTTKDREEVTDGE